MSSTSRGAQRLEDDWYCTPAWVTRAILRTLGSTPSRIIEPTAGTGAIVTELRNHWPNSMISAVEIDEGRSELIKNADVVHCCDFLKIEEPRRYDLAITNPPFVLAMPVLKKCMELARETVLLLRLNYCGSQDRAPFWRANPADLNILPKRPSFCASLACTDKKGCGWKLTLPLDAERPKRCPQCGGKRTVGTTDSIEYAWFRWGPGVSGRWSVLELEEAAA